MAQVLGNAAATAAMYFLIGLSFSLVYSTSRFFNFAHAAFIVAAPYGAYWIATALGAVWPLALVVGIAASTLVAVALDLLVFQSLIERRAPAAMPLIASLGVYVIMQAVIALIFGSASLPFGNDDVQVFAVGGSRLTSAQLLIVGAAVLCGGSASVWLRYSRAGRLLRAVGADRDLARIWGADPVRASIVATGIGTALAGLAGCLSAADTGLVPSAGFALLLGGAVAMVIGGVGSMAGLLLGSIIVAALEHTTEWWLSAEWERLTVFGLLLFFLICRPHGIYGWPGRATSN